MKRARDDHARLASLIDHAPDGIFVADLDGRYVEVNESGCRMLGYSREEILGRTIADLVVPEEVQRVWKTRDTLLRGAVQVAEWTLIRRDGSRLAVEVSAKILPDGTWQGFVRDISERKRLERMADDARERLRESEERFRLTIEEAPIGMALVALDGRFVRVNRALCEIVGYSAEELTGLTFQAITHPDDLDADLALAGQLYRGEIPRYQLAKRYLRKDGSIVDVMLSGSVLRGPKGEPLNYIAQIEDITERKRLQDELRRSEARSSGILSISADAIISIDETQRITLFNEGAEKIFGWSNSEAIGAPLDLLIPERFRAVHRRHVEGFAAGEKVSRRMGERDTPIFGLRKNGEEFPADAAISKLEVGGRRILTVALRDISDQKRIENEQRFLADLGPVLSTTLEYEETLSRIVDVIVRSLADLCIVDIVEEDGEVRRLRVVSRDPSKAWLCELFQKIPLDREQPHLMRSALETKRSTLLRRVSPATIEELSQSEDHLRALRALELQSIMTVPLMAHGRLLGVIALASSTPSRLYGKADLDLAEQLAQRAALAVENARLYRAAQRAIQARDDLLGIVAHDLRTPLGTILIQAARLRREPEREHQVGRPAELIERAAVRMHRLIRDLLDVTRMEVGRLTLERVRVRVDQLVSEALEAHRAIAASSSLDLRLELGRELPEISADRDRLDQVLENLIGNALKFTRPGGRVTVGARRRDGEVLFWVSDTGPGLAPTDLPHVFDRFWQGRAKARQGAGLGLPIAKGIVESHGGRIWVESAPRRGSTFFFTIPIAPREETKTRTPAPRAP